MKKSHPKNKDTFLLVGKFALCCKGNLKNITKPVFEVIYYCSIVMSLYLKLNIALLKREKVNYYF